MKKILRVVLTKEYLLKATLIIFLSTFLAWLCRENLYRMLYILIIGGWGLRFLYVKQEPEEENDL